MGSMDLSKHTLLALLHCIPNLVAYEPVLFRHQMLLSSAAMDETEGSDEHHCLDSSGIT